MIALTIAATSVWCQDLPLSRMAMSSVRDTYSRTARSIVWVYRLKADGRHADRCSGFISGKDEITTAFECVVNTARMEIVFENGRKVQTDSLFQWNRTSNWATMRASTSEPALPIGDPASVKSGDSLDAFNVEATLVRTLAQVNVKLIKSPDIGEIFELDPWPSPASVGGPLLDPAGGVVAILSSTAEAIKPRPASDFHFDIEAWPRYAIPTGASPSATKGMIKLSDLAKNRGEL